MIVAIQANTKQRLAAISIRKILNAGGLSNTFMGGVKRADDSSLALVPQTGQQLNEASRLMEVAKLEEGNDFFVVVVETSTELILVIDDPYWTSSLIDSVLLQKKM
jgi:hypothetical protein